MLQSYSVRKCLLLTRHLQTNLKRGAKTMEAWQALQYGGFENLQLNAATTIPLIKNNYDVLVKVHAASINPLDVKMLGGYGATICNFMRQITNCSLTTKDFPLILGRDFSGTVVHIGKNVEHLQVGDEVWGAVGAWQQGSHAEYVLGSIYNTCKKPSTLSHIEAASFPYAALTAWSSLCYFGQLSERSIYGKRVLITGASGGVGTFALQLLKLWGANVTVTCSPDAVTMLQDLGADTILDYHSPDFRNNLKELKGLDIIFDNIGKDYPNQTTHLLKSWNNCKYITPVSPFLKNTDDKGLLFGTFVSSLQAAFDTAMNLKEGRSFRWTYFVPDARALQSIAKLIDNHQIKPVIQEVYYFKDMINALEAVSKGHTRGKIVVNYEAASSNDDTQN